MDVIALVLVALFALMGLQGVLFSPQDLAEANLRGGLRYIPCPDEQD